MFAIVHINLEQALGWVTVPMRIREVGIININWMELQIVGKCQIVDNCLLMQCLQSILEVPQVGHKILVLNPSIFESKEDDFPWWHIWVDFMSKDVLIEEGLGDLPWGWRRLLVCHGCGVGRMIKWISKTSNRTLE
jgi:hypothetical protein